MTSVPAPTTPSAPRRNVLLVTPTVPYPPNWGFGIRVFHIIKELSKHSDVTVVCFAAADDGHKVEALRAICSSVHTSPLPLSKRWRKRLAQLLSLVSRRSFQSAAVTTDAMRSTIRNLLREHPFDIVQLESSQLASVADLDGLPWIVDEHNIEYELLQRMYEVETSPLRKFYNWLEFRKFQREEQTAWRRCTACVVTSTREQAIVNAREPSKPTHVAPNGVDIDFFAPVDTPIDRRCLVYTGLMSYRPNTDAVTFFVAEVLPLIVEHHPDIEFRIVGLEAEASVGFLAGPNVRVIGDVPDVRPYVHDAAVFVVPLRMGSGTRLKILEGLAMGKAMVSTTVGCEGIEVSDEDHLLIADDPAAFAAAVLRLLDDPALGERLGRSGRELVAGRYSWVKIVEELGEFHERVITSSATR